MEVSPYDVAGVVGAVLIGGAYVLLQTERLEARSHWFSGINALGALAILISLVEDFNLGALVIESFWLIVSLYGLARARRAL